MQPWWQSGSGNTCPRITRLRPKSGWILFLTKAIETELFNPHYNPVFSRFGVASERFLDSTDDMSAVSHSGAPISIEITLITTATIIRRVQPELAHRIFDCRLRFPTTQALGRKLRLR